MTSTTTWFCVYNWCQNLHFSVQPPHRESWCTYVHNSHKVHSAHICKRILPRLLGGKPQKLPRVTLFVMHTRKFLMVHLCYWCLPPSTSFYRGNWDTKDLTPDKSACCREEITVKAPFSSISAWAFTILNHSTNHKCDRISHIGKASVCRMTFQ